jgi:hypothetical protein
MIAKKRANSRKSLRATLIICLHKKDAIKYKKACIYKAYNIPKL